MSPIRIGRAAPGQATATMLIVDTALPDAQRAIETLIDESDGARVLALGALVEVRVAHDGATARAVRDVTVLIDDIAAAAVFAIGAGITIDVQVIARDDLRDRVLGRVHELMLAAEPGGDA